MKKRSPKTKSTQKTKQDRPYSKFLTLVKKLMVNSAGQRSEVNSTVCWRHWMTCVAAMVDDVALKGVEWRVRCVKSRWRVRAHAVHFRQVETWGGTWGRVWAPLGQFLVGFWSEKSDLSHCDYGSTIWLMNRLDLKGSGWVWRQRLASDSGYKWRRG